MGFDPSYTGQTFKSVGTRPLRPDGFDKVTGRARYGADFNMPGQLVGRLLRSPQAGPPGAVHAGGIVPVGRFAGKIQGVVDRAGEQFTIPAGPADRWVGI